MTYDLQPALPPTATPKDYARIHFDPAEVPATRIVGLLACQRDPLLKSLTRRIVRVDRAQAAPLAQKGRAKQKKGGNNAKGTPTAGSGSASASGTATPAEPNEAGNGEDGGEAGKEQGKEQGELWEVVLEDTVLFPEGGGQPWDTGFLTLVDEAAIGDARNAAITGPNDANGNAEGPNSNLSKNEHNGANPNVENSAATFPVEAVIRRGLEAIHVLRLPASLDPASLVGRLARVDVDWPRRLDHMTTHTAQHLLSAVLDKRGLNTLSWGMPAYPSTEAPYIELPRGLTWKEVEEVEEECNKIIERDVKVWIDFSVQGSATTEEEERENRGIPKDYSGGVIRHCNIQHIDRNACCGTQLPSLSPISSLHILPPSTPFDSSSTTSTPTRLFFVAGPRAARHLREASRALSRSAQVVGVGRHDLSERLQRIEKVRFDTAEREKALRIELSRAIGTVAAEQGDRAKVVRSSPSTHDYDFLAGICGGYSEVRREGVIVAISTAEKPVLAVVQSKDEKLGKEVFDRLKTGLTEAGGESGKGRVKGGGARGRFMAKVEGKWGKGEEEAVEKALRGE